MKQEPVAWIDYLEDSNIYDLNVSGRGVPLYTAPRELSDEEIEQLQAEYDIDSGLTCHSVRDFARAILRKAQEK